MSDDGSLPHGWSVLPTPSGHPLYYCAATRQTSWQPPARASGAAAAASSSSNASTASAASAASAASTAVAPSPPQRFPIESFPIESFPIESLSKRHSHAPEAALTDVSARYTFPTLVHNTRSRARGSPLFELEREKVLQINLGSTADRVVWIRSGSMIARRGKISFSRQSFREEGVSTSVKRALTGEGIRMTKCEGKGTIYCAADGRAVCLVQLRAQSVFVNGSKIVALSQSVEHDVRAMRSAGAVATGLFCVKVSGSGFVAFVCEKAALTLQASADDPVYTDADSTVAWTHHPTLKVDVSLPLCAGRRSGHELQLKFAAGVVVVQPYKAAAALLPARAKSVGAHVASAVLHSLT